jgi:hypothetical protein
MIEENDYMLFYQTVETLVDLGYELKICKERFEDEEWLTAMSISSNNNIPLRYAFCTPSEHTFSSLSGKISADHIDCFDKWSKCPLNVPLPQTDREFQLLIAYFNFLQTDDGYEKSNKYEYQWWVTSYAEIEKLLVQEKSNNEEVENV